MIQANHKAQQQSKKNPSEIRIDMGGGGGGGGEGVKKNPKGNLV